MGRICDPQPVKLFVGMLAGKPAWFDRAEAALVERYGPVDIASETWDFTWTDYYRDEMGEELLRKFLAFDRLIRPDDIIDIKCDTNTIETDLARRIEGGPARPINLDPGYVELSKVVLATTKDYAHRLYLARGIYAEVTLQYTRGRYEPCPWTYPDYRTPEYGKFFLVLRERLRQNLRSI